MFMPEMVNALTAEDWHMFKELKEQGMSISEISRSTGVSGKTVRKHLAMDKPNKYSRKGRQSVIAPYTDYVRGRIDTHNLSAVRIYEEIREKGYRGSIPQPRCCAGILEKIVGYWQYTDMRQNRESSLRWILAILDA